MTIKSTIFTCDCCGEDFEGEVSPYWPSLKNGCKLTLVGNKSITLLYTKLPLPLKEGYCVELHKYDYADLCTTCTDIIVQALRSRLPELVKEQHEAYGACAELVWLEQP